MFCTKYMINNIAIINSFKTKFITRIKHFKSSKNFGIPKLKKLSKDIFCFSSKDGIPEVMTYNPPIINGKYNSGIIDRRLVMFGTEYRAYDFEGYDNKFPSRYVCIDSKGERRLKPHVYITLVEVHPAFARQGAYKNAIKRLAETLKFDEECEGRIILDARKIESPDMTKIPSPALAHWKCGFRFVREEDNKVMQKVLNGELPPEDAPEGTMYYSLA